MDFLLQRHPTAQPLAFLGNEFDRERRQKLLQCPAAPKPPAPTKGLRPRYTEGRGVSDLRQHPHITQIYIALCCALTPAEHRINGRAELLGIRLVDTTRVHSEVSKAV
jgi:hypothetical protein